VGNKWYYGPKEDKKGPFSKAEITNFIRSKTITPETLLWENRAKKGYIAIKTEFGVNFPLEDFLALAKNSYVPDYFMWIGVFVPFLVVAVLYALYFAGWMPFENTKFIGAIMTVTVLIAATFDAIVIERKGYKLRMEAIVYIPIFGYPIYFYYRNKLLRRKQIAALVSLGCMLLSMVIFFSFPLCTDKGIEEAGIKIINNMLQPLRPEITAECTSVSLQKRLPGAKFEIVGHLSDSEKIEMTLVQSGRYLRLSEKDIKMTEKISLAFLKFILKNAENQSGSQEKKP
jgi:hypothetical protein